MSSLQKWGEAGLIHRPHIVDEALKTKHSVALGEANPRDRPQKIKCTILMIDVSYSGNNHKRVHSSSRPYISCNVSSVNEYDKAADLNDPPKLFLSRSLSIFSDLADDGKLGYGFTSANELEEVDIGPGDKPRPTFVNKKLDPSLGEPMIALLKEYSDCFAWDYTEMPGLDRSIVEHRLPLKKGFRPFQQWAHQMRAEVLEEVKKEIEKMLQAGFIKPCMYAEGISSIVSMQKKDGRWRVCMDFRDLNRATLKDEYSMPVVETLVNAVAGNKILSFMDGNVGYI
jgi:hypothetical protein